MQPWMLYNKGKLIWVLCKRSGMRLRPLDTEIRKVTTEWGAGWNWHGQKNHRTTDFATIRFHVVPKGNICDFTERCIFIFFPIMSYIFQDCASEQL